MHWESSSALYLGAWQGNSNPKTDEMAVLSRLTGTAWVSPLTPMGSVWYLSTDNCNLGGEGKSERASQKCKWLREGAACTWGQRPRPIPVDRRRGAAAGALCEETPSPMFTASMGMRKGGIMFGLWPHTPSCLLRYFLSEMDSWSKGLELGKSWMKRAALQNQTSLYSVIQIKQQKAKVVDYLKILACFLRVVLTFPMQVFLSLVIKQ